MEQQNQREIDRLLASLDARIAARSSLDRHVPLGILKGVRDAIERLKKERDGLAEQAERMMTTYADDQEVLKGLEQERDAALTEVERLKGELQASRENEAMA